MGIRLAEGTEKIIELIAENSEGISIHEVAENLGIHRNTAAKYLEILHSQGLVEVKKIGVTKLYYSSRMTPLSCVIRLFSEPVFGIDRGRIIRSVNQSALDLMGLLKTECIGRSLVMLDEHLSPGIFSGILPALRGDETTFQAVRHTCNGKNCYVIKGIPVRLENGRSGAALIVLDSQSVEGAQIRLRFCEQQLDQLKTVSYPFIAQFSDTFEIIFANEGFLQTFHPTSTRGSGGRLLLECFEKDDSPLRKAIECAKETGEHKTNIRMIHSSGDVRHYQWTIRASQDSDNWKFLAVGIDVTEHFLQKEQFNHFFESAEMLFGKRTQDLREINRQLYNEISERKKSEETLRMYEHTLRNVADMVFWFTRDGHVTFYNDSAKQALKLPDENDKIWISSFIPHPPLGDWNIFHGELMRQGSIVLQTSMIRQNQEIFPVEIRFTFISYGGREYCCSVARDIHERIEALDKLVVSESRFRELAETISDVVYIRDLVQGKIDYLNRAFELIYQRPIQEMYVSPSLWSSSIHPDDRDRVMMLSEGESSCDRLTMEYRIIRPSGDVRWVRSKIYYVRDSMNTPIREIGVITDCSQEKRIQDELKEINERFYLALHAAPVVMFGQDNDLVYTWVENSSMGLTDSDIIGYTDHEIFPKETADELHKLKSEVLAFGKPCNKEVEVHLGGKMCPIHLFLRPYRNVSGEITGLIGAAIEMQDMLHQKRRSTLTEIRYRKLFDAIHEGYIVFSSVMSKNGEICDFCITDLNHYAVRRINRSKKELIGRKLSDFRPDIDHLWIDTLLDVARSGNQKEFVSYSEFFKGYYSFQAFLVGEDLIGAVIRDVTDEMRRNEHLQAYRDLAMELSATTNIHHALDLILDTALQVPGIDSGGLYILHDEEKYPVLKLYTHKGLSDSYVNAVCEVVVDENILGLFHQKIPNYITIDDPESDPIRPVLQEEGLRSFVLIPLYEGGILIGCLNLGSHSLPDIPEREKPFLEALSGWLGKTLQRFMDSDKKIDTSGYVIVKPDGSILEGTLWKNRIHVPEDLTSLIQKNHANLLTGKEIEGFINGHLQPYVIRFCPWGDDVAYIIRSGGDRS